MDKIKDKKYFEKLLKELKKLYKPIKYKYIEKNETFNVNTKYIDSNISKTFINHDKCWIIDKPEIKIKIYNKKKNFNKEIQEVINRFYTIIALFNKYKIPYNKQKFIVNYIPTKFKKKLPKKNQILTPFHINSGLSYIFQNEICIFREEEFKKVFIHELFHCLGFDRFTMYDSFNKSISNVFKLSQDINGNEAYNELAAMIYNCCFLNIEEKKNVINLIEKNRIYTIHQIIQIMKHYNSNSLSDFKKNLFKQKTAVFSYFILKGFYLYYFNDLINIIKKETIYFYPKYNDYIHIIIRFNNIILKDKQYYDFTDYLCKNLRYIPNSPLLMTIN